MRALAFALLVLTLATGCSRVSQPEGSAHAGNAWTHHGLLRIVDLSEPDSLNPLVGNQQIDAELAYLWGGYLFNYNDRDEFVPELATAMPTLRNGGISRDGRTIVYRLRRGVQWQDGKNFGADDVIFTWHAILNKKNNIPSTVGYDVISRIDKRDDHTIVVHLKAAYAPFTSTFFTASGDPYPILPAHLLASYPNINRIAYNSAPIGTGPLRSSVGSVARRSSFVRTPTTGAARQNFARSGIRPFPTKIRSSRSCARTKPISNITARPATTRSSGTSTDSRPC